MVNYSTICTRKIMIVFFTSNTYIVQNCLYFKLLLLLLNFLGLIQILLNTYTKIKYLNNLTQRHLYTLLVSNTMILVLSVGMFVWNIHSTTCILCVCVSIPYVYTSSTSYQFFRVCNYKCICTATSLVYYFKVCFTFLYEKKKT